MRRPRIFTGQDITTGICLQLEPGPSRHLGRALRMHTGDSISLFNGNGCEWPCEITAIERNVVSVLPGEPEARDPESPLAVHLGIAISRGDRMDTVLQKATELGVTAVTPLFSERTEVKLKGDRETRKLAHWRQVAISACEQSGRNRLPIVNAPGPLPQWLNACEGDARFVLHHRGAGHPTPDQPPRSVDLLIGPEGGLTDGEIEAALAHGFAPMTLGPRVLRTETAPLAALAILQARWGDMGPAD